MAPVRVATVLALVVTVSILAAPARGEIRLLPGLPPLCLPQIHLPLLECSTGTPSAEPTWPGVVTPTTVRFDPRRVIVGFRQGTPRSAIDAVFARAGVSRERKLTKLGLYVVATPQGKRDQALASLRREHSVGQVERETLLDGLDTTPNDPAWPDQWGLRTAGFPRAWDVTHGSSKIIVAVLDTGVDGSHPDLKGAMVPGRDIVHRDDDPADDNGHGTAVAGIIAARGNNGIGLAGACWTCLVMPVKVLGKDGTRTTGDVSAGIVWAADHGARVINLSLGAPGTTDALSEAIAYASSKDVVVVASAGNSGSVTPFYPAADGSVISVAASNPSDQLYSWSNRGTWVLVAAPGCNDAPWPGGEYVLVLRNVGRRSAGCRGSGPLSLGETKRERDRDGRRGQQCGRRDVSRRASRTRERGTGAVGPERVEQRDGPPQNRRYAWTPQCPDPLPNLQADCRGRSAGRHPRFGALRRLSLMLSQPGRRVVRVSGKSPLRLRRTVSAGPITLVIRGHRAKASYRLTLSYAVQ